MGGGVLKLFLTVVRCKIPSIISCLVWCMGLLLSVYRLHDMNAAKSCRRRPPCSMPAEKNPVQVRNPCRTYYSNLVTGLTQCLRKRISNGIVMFALIHSANLCVNPPPKNYSWRELGISSCGPRHPDNMLRAKTTPLKRSRSCQHVRRKSERASPSSLSLVLKLFALPRSAPPKAPI